MRTLLESIQNTSTIKLLADFLTSIKSKNFSGFTLPFKLPLDASKYTVMELEEFDPVVSGSVAQTGDEMWVLVMGGDGTIANTGEVWVYKRYNNNWDIYSRGVTANFKQVSKTSTYPIDKLRRQGAVLYMTRLEGKSYKAARIKLNRVTLNSWVRRMGGVLHDFPRKQLEGGYGQDHGLKSIDLNPNCVVFVCPNMGMRIPPRGTLRSLWPIPRG